MQSGCSGLTRTEGESTRELRDHLLMQISSNNAVLRRLIDAWIVNFDKGDESFVDVARKIDHSLAARDTGVLELWKEAHKTYDIFNGMHKFADSHRGIPRRRYFGQRIDRVSARYRHTRRERLSQGHPSRFVRETFTSCCEAIVLWTASSGPQNSTLPMERYGSRMIRQ